MRSKTAASGNAWAAETSADAKLRVALQKRLLIPDPHDITIGPPLPGPIAGITHRTITISAQGQKFMLDLLMPPSSDKGVIVQHYALFDEADPWEHVDVKSLHLNDRPTLGPAGAPVKIVEFADFECPFCAKAFGEIETVVNTTYKGKVQLIWKNFPLDVHPWAEQAAIAAQCAWQQNPQAFWTFARNFYRDQSEITPQNLRKHIDDYAGSLNLDEKALNACMLGNSAQSVVEQDKKDGTAVHINSTPTFLVNGVPVVGLPSSNVFDFAITSQLQARNGAQ